ncbi:hypothetical protein HAX54_021053, partial [Datura stramonium]|nr:hypothetical protein [Datura stramonium]
SLDDSLGAQQLVPPFFANTAKTLPRTLNEGNHNSFLNRLDLLVFNILCTLNNHTNDSLSHGLLGYYREAHVRGKHPDEKMSERSIIP